MNPKRLTRREALKIGAGLIIGTSIKIAAADSTPGRLVKPSAVILATSKARTNWYTDGWSSPVAWANGVTY